MAVSRITKSSVLQGFPKSRSLLAGNTAYDPAAFFLIQRTTPSSGATSVTFSSIPQTYKHLQIRSICKTSTGGPALVIQFNSDTGSNYKSHYLEGNGATAYAGVPGTITYGYCGYSTPATANANMFGATIIDIHDYANTTKYKTTRSLSGYDTNNTVDGYMDMFSNLWLNTSAISTITLTLQGSGFTTGSTFALYGMVG